jgi:hypothetical protein
MYRFKKIFNLIVVLLLMGSYSFSLVIYAAPTNQVAASSPASVKKQSRLKKMNMVAKIKGLSSSKVSKMQNKGKDMTKEDVKELTGWEENYAILMYPTYNGAKIEVDHNDPIFEALWDRSFSNLVQTDSETYYDITDDIGLYTEQYWGAIEENGTQYLAVGYSLSQTPGDSQNYTTYIYTDFVDSVSLAYSSLKPNLSNCSTDSKCVFYNEVSSHEINSLSATRVSPSGDLSVTHNTAGRGNVGGYYETYIYNSNVAANVIALTDTQNTSDTTTFNVEDSNQFHQNSYNSYRVALDGGYWGLYSFWIDEETDASAGTGYNQGSGYSLSWNAAANIVNVIMDATGDYSGVWGDEIVISGNGFGDINQSVSSVGVVRIGGREVEIIGWEEQVITVRIPQGDIDASNQSGVPVEIVRSDNETEVVNVTFDNTDDSPAGTDQVERLNAVDAPNDNGHTVNLDFQASNDDSSSANHNEQVMEYRVYRYQGQGPSSGDVPVANNQFIKLATIDATESLAYFYTDNVPQNGVDYTYYVTAVDKNGNEQLGITAGNRSVVQATDNQIDELELSLDPGDETLGVSWNHDNEGGDVSYTICYAENSDLLQGSYDEMEGRDGVTCVTTSGSSTTFTDLENGTRYYVRGYADDGEGNISVTGIYYADLEADLPESAVLGNIVGNIPASIRLFAVMILFALGVGFANMSLIRRKVVGALHRK